jgi:hypothetical protein
VDVYEVIYASSVFYELFELSSVIYASVFDDASLFDDDD